GSGIVHSCRQGPHRADGSNIQNTSLPLANHLLVNRFGDCEETANVSIDNFVPGAVGGGREVVAAINGSIVDQNIYPAPLLHNLAGKLLQAKAVRNRNLITK